MPGLSTVKTACVSLSPLAGQRATGHKAVKAEHKYQKNQDVLSYRHETVRPDYLQNVVALAVTEVPHSNLCAHVPAVERTCCEFQTTDFH